MNAGDQVPGFERLMDFASMIAYAGATWDWHRIHYDPDVIAASKLPGPLVDGQVFGALIAEQIMDWLGPRAFITNLSFRFKNMVFAGDKVRLEGEIVTAGDGIVETKHRVMCGDKVAVDGAATTRLPS